MTTPLTETTDYDFNLWVDGEGTVTLSAYQYKMQNGYLTTNTSKWHTLLLSIRTSDLDTKAINFLLGVFDETEVYIDLDLWHGDRSVFVTASAPAVIREFVGALPTYSY